MSETERQGDDVSDVVFSESIRKMQDHMGTAEKHRVADDSTGWATELSEDAGKWIEMRDSFYLGTAGLNGQPYIQHRGGPPGFVRVINKTSFAFADFAGNQQYISTGNLLENPKAFAFFMSYETRQRLKFWGRARFVEDEAQIRALMPSGYRARAERAIVFEIEAWSVNCPQHITPRYRESDIQNAVSQLQHKIANLELELANLKGGATDRPS